MKKNSARVLCQKFNLSLLLFISLGLAGCSQEIEPSSQESNDSETSEVQANPNPGEKVRLIDGVQLDEARAFFDDFSDGLSPDDWIIGNGAWGHGNGGVVPQNVSYTDDGVLLLRGNGLYYAGDEIQGVGQLKDGRNSGAAIISQFATGPGRYEAKMKPLPRQGACTALWTFSNQPVEGKENDNHEIDIELPGGKSEGVISFKNVLNTNYVTERMNISQDIDLKETMQKEIYLNDGEFHTFGFDWYTDPEMIVYYCDGKITAISDSFIPNLQSKLWLGVWFPDNVGFVGQSYFETDYLQVDWVKYIPFKNQPSVPFIATPSVAPALENQYPESPVSYPEVNLISNGDFEYVKNHKNLNDYAWTYTRLNTEDKPESEVCFPSANGGDESYGVNIIDGGYLYTEIDSTYEGMKYRLEFDAKSTGLDSMVIANFTNAVSSESLKSFETIIDSTSWKHYSMEIEAPKDAYMMNIEAFSDTAGAKFNLDNFKLTRI